MKEIKKYKMYAAVQSDGGDSPSLYWMYLPDTAYKVALEDFNRIAGDFIDTVSLGPKPVLLFVKVDRVCKYTKEKDIPLEYVKKEESETITILKSIQLTKVTN